MSTTPHESSPATPPPNAALGAAQTVLSFLGQASRENPSEASTSTAVLGAATNVLSRLASSSAHHHHHHHASSTSRPIPEVPEEHLVEAPGPAEVPQRVVEPTPQAPTTASSHGGASSNSGGVRTSTPPRGTARVTRSYPALHEPTPIPRPVPAHTGGVYRRSTGPYLDSETIWNAHEDGYPVRFL
jgi:hypothetical protein